MDTNPAPGSTTNPTADAATASQAQQDFAAALATADSTAAQNVQAMGLGYQARLSGLKRAAAAAIKQYGATSSQAQQAQAAVTATSGTISRIAVFQKQQSAAAPSVSSTGWVLHGRVYDAQLQALSRHTVFLVDATKSYQEAYGFAYTDETGYFLINYAGPSKAPAGAAPAAPELYVEVVDTKAQPVYLATTVFSPAAGSATYQNITLTAGAQPLGDPPEAIRKVAIPPNQ
jgi:hypothetical protein